MLSRSIRVETVTFPGACVHFISASENKSDISSLFESFHELVDGQECGGSAVPESCDSTEFWRKRGL